MDLEWVWGWIGSVKNLSWQELKSVAELILYYMAVVAVLGCLFKLKTIRSIIQEFNQARGPIWDLRQTIKDLQALEPVIRQLGGQIDLLDAKVDAARKQVAELQVESISGRTDTVDEELNGAPVAARNPMNAPEFARR